MDTGCPCAREPHLTSWAVLWLAALAIVVGDRLVWHSNKRATPWTPEQMPALAGAGMAAAVALTWPLANSAVHWSLTTLVIQRLILTLAVASLVSVGMPYDLLEWLTHPAPIDTALDWCRRPAAAVGLFAVTVVGSMATPVVEAEASSPVVRGVMDLVVVAAGFVLWLPIIGRAPGIRRLKPAGRLVYLVVQAVVPAFLSFISIFARRPLYSTFGHSHLAVGLRPLNDRQISGFVSKLTMLFVPFSVGAVVLNQALRVDEEYGEDEPLVWADVERQLERAAPQWAERQARPRSHLSATR